MLIQNASNTGQITQPATRASNDAPVVANTPVREAESVTPQKPSTEQLKSAVDNINHAMRQAHQSLEFSVDSTTKTPVVKMTDSSTGEVIGQFPSEAALAIARSIDQIQPGLLLKQQA